VLKHAAMIAFIAAIFPIMAVACPSLQQNPAEKDRIHAELLAAENEMQGRAIGGQLWHIWTTAPDKAAQDMLDSGRERIRLADYETAERILGELIEYCPDYAEGWNQRAFVRFLRQDYGNALSDIEHALDREPRHFGALAGRATTLITMGRVEVGHAALRKALEVNPWLSERHMLLPEERT